jgi:RHS repeat-associated protein
VLPWSGGLNWWTDDASSNPDSYEFPGYILTMQDGTEYRIERESLGEKTFVSGGNTGNYAHVYGSARLVEIKSRSNDKIKIGTNRIDHVNPSDQLTRSIWLQRDEENRIIAINDPISGSNGVPVVKYDYAGENLIRVHRLVDRVTSNYLTTTYTYTNRNYPYFITGITDPRGIQVTRNLYDDAGRLIGIIDADGRTNKLVHDLVARTETITNRLGDRTIHAYDARGNVVQSIDALGFNTYRGYDTTNNLIWEANHLNQTNWFFYDTNRFLIATRNPLGHTNGTVYNTNGQVLISFDALGRGTTNVYDSKGNLTSTTDALGNPTTFLYDPNSRLAAQIDALGTVSTNTYDSAGNLTHVVVKSAAGQVLGTNSFAYDGNGNRTNQTVTRTLADGTKQAIVTTYIYDGQSRLVHTIESDGYTNSVVYNAIGQQEFTIDKLGRTNRFEYDAQGRMFKHTFPDGTSELSFFDAEGRRTNSVDRAGRPTSYVHDKLGRLTHTIFADGATNQTVYDEVGRVRSTIDARGKITAFSYDGAGHRTSITNAHGITSLQSVARYAYDAVGSQTNIIDALNRTNTYVYDSLNRRTQVIFPDNTRQTTGYDLLSRRISETDQATNTARFAYDGLGRLTHITNALGHVISYSYDETGNQLTQTDARTNTIRFDYDSLGRRVKRTMPGGESETSRYDAGGNMIAHTNFNGFALTNRYDAMNRLLSRHVATNGAVLESYGYSGSGQRLTMSDSSGTYAYAYDQRDRLKTNTTPQGALRYTYDSNGNMLTIRSLTPNGTDLTYQYDALNRLTNVSDARLSGMAANNTTYGFDAVGNLQRYSYPNGLTNLYQFDSLNRLTNLIWKHSGNARADFAYRLGLAGNRTNLSETVDGTLRSFSWSYDALYRLTAETISGASPSGTLGYNYDQVGNRTNRSGSIGSVGAATYAYGSNDWLTTEFYDKNGNTTNSAGGTYRYDYANRLTNYVNGTTNVSITYNADGDRVSKTVNGSMTVYLVDRRNLTGYCQVLEELTVSGTITNVAKTYTYGLDLISQLQISPLLITFYGYDGHGSARFLTGTNGVITDTYAYDAYGTLITSVGSVVNDYLYVGEQWDKHLNLYFFRQRYNNPATGRFLTSDSFEGNLFDPLSLHKYLYAHADPVNKLDPTGQSIIIEALADFANRLYLWVTSASASARAFRYGLIALNAIALVQDPGAFVSMGPAATAEIIAADVTALFRGSQSLYRHARAAWATRDAFKTLAGFRQDIGVPPIELDTGKKRTTAAMLEIGGNFWIGRRFLGRSPNKQTMAPPLNPNPITAQHAEADAFNQAVNAGVTADRATLYVDRAFCGACGQRGGVKSMAKALGIKELTVITPAGTQTIVIDPSVNPPTQVPVPVGLLYEFLAALDDQ